MRSLGRLLLARLILVFAVVSLLAGCAHAPPPRHWHATRGDIELRFSETADRSNMSGDCSGDSIGCTDIGELVESSATGDELADRLRGAGFAVVREAR